MCQSREAYDMAEIDAYEEKRLARAVNNEIVTDSESDNPDDYVGISDGHLDEKTRNLIEKKRKAIRRRAK